ncbi:hypothetical protein ABZP36_009870 [Zizania latifolia]
MASMETAAAADVFEDERLAVVDEEPQKKSKKVAALDAFRGLTIVVSMYTHIYISHDTGGPLFFLFIVSVTIAFALKRVLKMGAAVKMVNMVRSLCHLPHIPMAMVHRYRPDIWLTTLLLHTSCLGPFEPEGLLSSISSVLSGSIEIHYGHVLTHKERLKHWLLMGFPLLVLGILLPFTNAIPINKQLYSFSYCLLHGWCGWSCSLSFLHIDMIDVWGLRTPFLFLEYIGMNAMLVFVLAAQALFPEFVNGCYYESPDNTLLSNGSKFLFHHNNMVFLVFGMSLICFFFLFIKFAGILRQACLSYVLFVLTSSDLLARIKYRTLFSILVNHAFMHKLSFVFFPCDLSSCSAVRTRSKDSIGLIFHINVDEILCHQKAREGSNKKKS